jgi:hypothetical protein
MPPLWAAAVTATLLAVGFRAALGRASDGGSEGMARPDHIINFANLTHRTGRYLAAGVASAVQGVAEVLRAVRLGRVRPNWTSCPWHEAPDLHNISS